MPARRILIPALLIAGVACHRVAPAPEEEQQPLSRGVLMEEFSDWACIPCAATARFLDSLLNRYPGLVVVRIPSGALDPADPLYTPISGAVQARAGLYGLDLTRGVPQVVIQGSWIELGFSDEARIRWAQRVETAGSELPRIRLEVLQARMQPDSSSGTLVLRLVGDRAPGDRLFLMLTEDSLFLSAPNGETLFSHVLRALDPPAGEPVDTVMSLSFALPSSVQHPAHVHVIPILQNVDSLEVLDVLDLPLPSFTPGRVASLRLTPEGDRDTLVSAGTYTIMHYILENLLSDPHPVAVTVTPDTSTPLPQDWNIFICVLGRCRNTASLVDTLPGGTVDTLFSMDVFSGSPDTVDFTLEVQSLRDSTRLRRRVRVRATP